MQHTTADYTTTEQTATKTMLVISCRFQPQTNTKKY